MREGARQLQRCSIEIMPQGPQQARPHEHARRATARRRATGGPAPGRWRLRSTAVLAAVLWPAGCGWSPHVDDAEPSASSNNSPSASCTSAGTGPTAVATPDAADDATSARPDRLVIVAGGDVNLGRQAGQHILRDPSYNPLADVAPVLATADLRFVNLESPLSEQDGVTQSPYHPLVFTGPPGGAEALVHAGIDVVSFANNHAWDYGPRALFETMTNLERVGIAYVGAAPTQGEQYRPAVLRARGWSVAVFAVTHIWNLGSYSRHPGRQYVAWANHALLANKLQRARREHDVVLLSYHGGGEYLNVPIGRTKRFVAAVMADGVDAVVGHHPHVPQGVGWFDGRPALYSLGNLVFDKRSDHGWERIGFLARLTVHADGRIALEACPYHLRGHTPQRFADPQQHPQVRQLARHLERISKSVGGTEIGEPGPWGCLPLRPPPAQPTDR